MDLPEKFDLNEWFVLVSLVLTVIVLVKLPKRFPHSMTVLILLYCMFTPKVFDTAIGTEPFDFYDINDSPSYEVFDLLTWFLYAPFGYFFIYFFDRWQIRGMSILIYITLCSLLGVGFEWLALKANVFTFMGWKSSYSLPVYLAVQSVYIAFFVWIKKLFYTTRSSDFIR